MRSAAKSHQSGGASLAEQGLGHADTCEIYQPAVERYRAAALARGRLHRSNDSLRLVDLRGRRREYFVGQRDLRRMNRPFALISQHGDASRRRAEPGGIAKVAKWPIDRAQSIGAARNQHAGLRRYQRLAEQCAGCLRDRVVAAAQANAAGLAARTGVNLRLDCPMIATQLRDDIRRTIGTERNAAPGHCNTKTGEQVFRLVLVNIHAKLLLYILTEYAALRARCEPCSRRIFRRAASSPGRASAPRPAIR